MNCKENFFGLVSELWACPPESLSFSEEIWKEKKYILTEDYTFKDSSIVFSIPIKNKSAECTESSGEELPGTSYEVSILWTVDNPSKEMLDTLQKLRSGYNHLIIKMFGSKDNTENHDKYLVYASEDGYRFEYNENKGKLECKLSVTNLNGLQRVL